MCCIGRVRLDQVFLADRVGLVRPRSTWEYAMRHMQSLPSPTFATAWRGACGLWMHSGAEERTSQPSGTPRHMPVRPCQRAARCPGGPRLGTRPLQ
jgi:hypothetical protein